MSDQTTPTGGGRVSGRDPPNSTSMSKGASARNVSKCSSPFPDLSDKVTVTLGAARQISRRAK
eukprot:1997454-Pleurochrysis_carterae.AAC.1